MQIRILMLMLVVMGLAACNLSDVDVPSGSGDVVTIAEGEMATVTRVIDGDTIDVMINGQEERVRYIGMNTPESDEACYSDATQANSKLVQGKTVTLVTDTSETDRYGRLLRYVYADGVFVNESLVRDGYAEAVSYPPDVAFYDDFVALEKSAASANRGCHSTGIFDDNSYTR